MYINSKSGKIFDVLNAILMIMISLICLYPLLYVLFASLSDPSLLTAHRGALIAPLGGTIDGYKLVLANPNIRSGFINTVINLVLGTFLNVVATCIAAYLVSRVQWMWSGTIMKMFTIHMFFNGGMIPFYLLVQQLGLINTRASLVIPGMIVVWNLILLRTSFRDVPDALIESARIDGAGEFRILWNIVVPVCKAAIAVQVLYYAVGHWNAWFNASIFLRDRSLYPLQLILREILISNDMQSMQASQNATEIDNYRVLTKYCVVIVSTVPILVIYPLLQKYFVKGVMLGSIKG